MTQFNDVVKADKLVLKNSNNAWKAQVLHFMEALNHLATDEQCKEVYKSVEKEAKKDLNWKPSNVYMSNKSVIIRAKRLGIAIVGKDGTPRGKSEVQNDCNAAEDNSKTDMEKFTAALVNATKYLDKIEEGQIPAAYVQVKALFDKANGKAAAMAESRKAA